LFGLVIVMLLVGGVIGEDEVVVDGENVVDVALGILDETSIVDEKVVDISDKLGLKAGTATGNKIKLVRNDGTKGLTKITFLDGGIVKIGDNVYSRLLGVKKGDENLEPQIYVDENGLVKEAYFTMGDSGNVSLGNENIKLPKGAKVIYENGEVFITYPAGVEVSKPTRLDKDVAGISKFYFTNENGEPWILGDYKFRGTLGVKDGKWFFDNHGKIEVNGEVIEIINPEKVFTYLDFEGKTNIGYDEAYLSLNKGKKSVAFGINKKGETPTFKFQSDSMFAPDVNAEGDFFVAKSYSSGKAKPSFVFMENRQSQNKVTRIATLEGFVFNEDGGSLYYKPEAEEIFWSKKLMIEGVEASSNFVPFKLEAYKVTDGNIERIYTDVDGDAHTVVMGNDGLVGIGPDAGWVAVKLNPYGGKYPGFYKGASEWLSYYAPPTERSFERFTGVNLVDLSGKVVSNPSELRKVMDILGSTPRESLHSLKKLTLSPNLVYGFWFIGIPVAGLASPGHVRLDVGRNGIVSPGVARHEIGHIRDFVVGGSGSKAFEAEWKQIKGSSSPHTYKYGYTGAEDTSTFVEMIYRDSWDNKNYKGTFGSWNQGLSSTYSGHKTVRAKAALFVKYGFMTKDEGARIFGLAGLPSDEGSLTKYIQEGQR